MRDLALRAAGVLGSRGSCQGKNIPSDTHGAGREAEPVADGVAGPDGRLDFSGHPDHRCAIDRFREGPRLDHRDRCSRLRLRHRW